MTYEEYAKIRDSKGYTDYKVAQSTGIGRSTFSDWKSGRSNPKPDKIKKIADFLGVAFGRFYDSDKEYYSALYEANKESFDALIAEKQTERIAVQILENEELRLILSANASALALDEIELIKAWREADAEEKRMIIEMLAYFKSKKAAD